VGLLNARQVDWTVFFSEKTVTGRSYLDMLELNALPRLQPQIILQYDGAPPHFCRRVRNHLDREIAGRWIGRFGPIAWPPRSLDLTTLDFFMWDYVKNIVYQLKFNDLQYLKAHMKATITPNMLQATWNEFTYRLDIEKTIYIVE
jgi:hypothetical protein